ncbi:MAG: ABC transporter permease, partial [Blastocatellia bacterium]|nr:ABC transporter permease [Blastocatellia bacterium]
METLWKDFHYGLRMLRRNYGLTAIAALSLALGIGATSAIFSVINAVMLRPLHYRDPDRLVMIYEHFLKNGHDRIKVAPNNFLDWQKSNRVFEEIGAAYMPEQKTISASWGEPEQVLCYLVTYNFFPLLGVEAYLGRTFTPQEDAPYKVGEEESPHGDRVVLLSYGIWQRRFGADPAIIGKTVQIDRVGHTVVGVMPPGFRFLDQPADVWVPLGLDPAKDYRAKFGRFLAVPARLKPGVTVQQAHDEMRAIGDQLARQFPGYNKGWTANVVPIEKQVIGNIGNTLWVLFGAVFFVLLIACANVASLRLAQGAAREKEMAIRASLGAGRLRLLVLLLIENIMLSGLGGALGLLLAFYLVKVLVAL